MDGSCESVRSAMESQPIQTTQDVLGWTLSVIFGVKHFSLRCATSSSLLSLLLYVLISSFFSVRNSEPDFWERYFPHSASGVLLQVVLSIIPDYLSLYKGRFLLSIIARSKTLLNILWLVALDLVACFLFSALCISAFFFIILIFYGHHDTDTYIQIVAGIHTAYFFISNSFVEVIYHNGQPGSFTFIAVIILTTTMTSIWTVSVLLSVLVLKSAISLNVPVRFTRWFFNIRLHPIQALGGTLAGMVFIGSLLWGWL